MVKKVESDAKYYVLLAIWFVCYMLAGYQG